MQTVHIDINNVPYVPSAVDIRFQSKLPVDVNLVLMKASTSTVITRTVASTILLGRHLLSRTAIPRK